jgi:hypothetical protein
MDLACHPRGVPMTTETRGEHFRTSLIGGPDFLKCSSRMMSSTPVERVSAAKNVLRDFSGAEISRGGARGRKKRREGQIAGGERGEAESEERRKNSHRELARKSLGGR